MQILLVLLVHVLLEGNCNVKPVELVRFSFIIFLNENLLNMVVS